jgi:hypothetical protein
MADAVKEQEVVAAGIVVGHGEVEAERRRIGRKKGKGMKKSEGLWVGLWVEIFSFFPLFRLSRSGFTLFYDCPASVPLKTRRGKPG